MPSNYNYQDGESTVPFDDRFVSADLFNTGNLWAWGNGQLGELGTNLTSNYNLPIEVPYAGRTEWKSVSAAENGSMGINADGTLWLWGENTATGRLGINNKSPWGYTPVTTFAGGNNWKQASNSGWRVAAIKTDGTLWTWGSNSSNALGTLDLSTSTIVTPVTTFAGGTNWKQVSCGGNHTAAIKTDGTLWIWGRNNLGQLGTNDTLTRSTPVTTFAGGNDWKQVSCGGSYSVAIKTDGTLWTWGLNINGQFGTNDTLTRSTPVTTFAGGNDWKQVSCGLNNTAAIKTDGTLWTWGANEYANVGDGTTIKRSTPVTTFAGGNNWKQVSCSRYHTASIKTDGTLWVWGGNIFGQLGTNDTIARSTPVTTFAGGTNWKQVSISDYHILALTYND